jgi:hypothetical protein
MSQQLSLKIMTADENIQQKIKQGNEDFSVTESNGLDDVKLGKALEKKFDLKEMVSQISHDYKANEESYGNPVGKEEW